MILLLYAGFSSPDISGQNCIYSNQSTTILVKQETGKPIRRPKAPDRQVVTCEYDGENLHLSFVYPEGSATLSVTDDSLLTATYLIDTDPLDLKVSVGSLSGTISVKIETEYGNTFVGDLP